MTRKLSIKIGILAGGLAALVAAEAMNGGQEGRTGPLTVISGAIAPEAHAVVGRPLTPVSYAGVARRTSRRTARRVSRRY
ncbi:hypothetical protein LNKW23_32090 [Paralimibaculum aggregatum]|uniref:Uncharacterized protein n=1 Tax=Paralimibaculum aggregatum TaxID=3036245 RepID=A0ABQ6LRS8_9RHOB|nr:hypothetical protein [Limibaculum sp. NKW23]GMG83995.1 hypothetical protein LNKW23_32090 [Limibaculum sp. NKW23]